MSFSVSSRACLSFFLAISVFSGLLVVSHDKPLNTLFTKLFSSSRLDSFKRLVSKGVVWVEDEAVYMLTKYFINLGISIGSKDTGD